MTRTINNLQWQVESPSFLKLVGYDIRLVFDGALWWLYSIDKTNTSARFQTRAKALEWMEIEINKLIQVSNRT